MNKPLVAPIGAAQPRAERTRCRRRSVPAAAGAGQSAGVSARFSRARAMDKEEERETPSRRCARARRPANNDPVAQRAPRTAPAPTAGRPDPAVSTREQWIKRRTEARDLRRGAAMIEVASRQPEMSERESGGDAVSPAVAIGDRCARRPRSSLRSNAADRTGAAAPTAAAFALELHPARAPPTAIAKKRKRNKRKRMRRPVRQVRLGHRDGLVLLGVRGEVGYHH